jgi:hypothetical protein
LLNPKREILFIQRPSSPFLNSFRHRNLGTLPHPQALSHVVSF